MSDLSDMRDLLALSHYNMASIILKQVSFYDRANAAIATWANLAAIVKSLDEKGAEWAKALTNPVDRVIEVARQGTFDGVRVNAADPQLQPNLYKIVYAGSVYEIVGVKTDDCEVINSSTEYSAVFMFAVRRLNLGVGEMAT